MFHVVHNTCIMHDRNIKTRYIGTMLILQFEKDWHSIKLDRMQLSFMEHVQSIVSKKCWTGDLRSLIWKKHTCHLDHHQRSHNVTIGFKNWTRKLIDNQKGKLFNSRRRSCSTSKILQSIPTNTKSKLWQIRTQDVIVVQNERKTSRSQKISVNSLNEELCSSDRSGQLDITQDEISVQTSSSEDNKSLNVEQTHYRSG